MATYYKHKYTSETHIPYEFQCEHCNKHSEVLQAKLTSEVTRKTMFKNLSPEDQKELSDKANQKLQNYILECKKDAENGIYASEFKYKCPHCKKPQSWAIDRVKGDRIVFGSLTGFFGFIVSFFIYDSLKTILNAILFILGTFFVGYIFGQIKLIILKKQTKHIMGSKAPTIHWSNNKHI